MNEQLIQRPELLKRLQRVAQWKALIVMGVGFPLVLIIAGLLSLFERHIRIEVLQVAFVVAFFGTPCILDAWLNAVFCPQRVLCPHCGHSLWNCATRNFKPRRIKIRPEITGCPTCRIPIV